MTARAKDAPPPGEGPVRVWAVPVRDHIEAMTDGAAAVAPTAELGVPRDGRLIDRSEVGALAEGLAVYGHRIVVGPPDTTYRATVGVEHVGPMRLSRPRQLPRPADPTSHRSTLVDRVTAGARRDSGGIT